MAGRLSQAQVADLLQACGTGRPPVLELDDLVSADTVGMDALMRIELDGAQLVGLPEYMRFELDALERHRTR